MASFVSSRRSHALAALAALCLAGAAAAQVDPGLRTAVLLGHTHGVEHGVNYLHASGRDLKLDVYYDYRLAEQKTARVPVVLNFHGGGWVAGERDSRVLTLLPWMQMGFAVVNVQYRLGNVALAPAAVEDTLCALQWVGRNADKYGFDLQRVVTTGDSAGGHLALATAMLPGDSRFTNQCAANEPGWSGPYRNVAPKVAAVVNWYGITDVADMLQGANTRSYAVAWFGSQAGSLELARALSPINQVRSGGPAVYTIHGDADKLVPYEHGVRLKKALDGAGVKNVLHTIAGGGHGGFRAEQQLEIYGGVQAFLRQQGILPAPRQHPPY